MVGGSKRWLEGEAPRAQRPQADRQGSDPSSRLYPPKVLGRVNSPLGPPFCLLWKDDKPTLTGFHGGMRQDDMSIPVRPRLKFLRQDRGTGLTCSDLLLTCREAETKSWPEASPRGLSNPQIHTRKPSSRTWVPTLVCLVAECPFPSLRSFFFPTCHQGIMAQD